MPEAATGSYLGFDVGSKRIGVAVGESITGHARPLSCLAASNATPDWTAVAKLIDEWQPVGLVVGLPRHDDGSASEMTRSAERFARRLEGRFGLPVHTIDERLSSREADERLAARGKHNKHSRRDGERDSVAASVILETWFMAQGPGTT